MVLTVSEIMYAPIDGRIHKYLIKNSSGHLANS